MSNSTQNKPYPGKFIPVNRVSTSKTKDRALQEDHEHDYVMDILMIMGVMTTATQYGKIDKILTKLLADARKEVEKKVEELRKTGDFGGEGVMEILDMTSEDLMDGFKDYNQAIEDVLSTLREEEGT